jgi:hypothetical protein
VRGRLSQEQDLLDTSFRFMFRRGWENGHVQGVTEQQHTLMAQYQKYIGSMGTWESTFLARTAVALFKVKMNM